MKQNKNSYKHKTIDYGKLIAKSEKRFNNIRRLKKMINSIINHG